MNLRDLQYLVALADLHSFSRAAEKCHVSQPTLSGQIKKLELWLGVQLLERSNRKVRLTEVGETIVRSSRFILTEVELIKKAANIAQDPLSGKFFLGAFPTLSTYIFPKLVQQVKTAMPKLRLILAEEKTPTLIEELQEGKLDAALLALPIHNDSSLISQKLFEDPFYLAVPPEHELAQHNQIDSSILTKYKLLLLEEGHCLRDQALEICQLYDLEEEQDFYAINLETLRQMVKAGMGITLMPKTAITQCEPGIRYIPFAHPSPYRTIGLLWRKMSARKAVIEQLCQLTCKIYNQCC